MNPLLESPGHSVGTCSVPPGPCHLALQCHLTYWFAGYAVVSSHRTDKLAAMTLRGLLKAMRQAAIARCPHAGEVKIIHHFWIVSKTHHHLAISDSSDAWPQARGFPAPWETDAVFMRDALYEEDVTGQGQVCAGGGAVGEARRHLLAQHRGEQGAARALGR
ncbi:hypothetical protein TREES_T100003230 [Tupaia chinensis]|uniref:Uncharacterized protein n=1 Tax=Tupaia chinensis TaxID=246437 RepID=L9K364_TUPCH|nr:hypothetical protein TREES_T100003230 [Tupaia chinensis]